MTSSVNYLKKEGLQFLDTLVRRILECLAKLHSSSKSILISVLTFGLCFYMHTAFNVYYNTRSSEWVLFRFIIFGGVLVDYERFQVSLFLMYILK